MNKYTISPPGAQRFSLMTSLDGRPPSVRVRNAKCIGGNLIRVSKVSESAVVSPLYLEIGDFYKDRDRSSTIRMNLRFECFDRHRDLVLNAFARLNGGQRCWSAGIAERRAEPHCLNDVLQMDAE